MPASARPSAEIQTLIDAAAKRWKVPNTLIMAIGRVETGFDASYAAASPSTSRGMFRATDELRAISDSFQREGASDAEQQIMVVASSLAVLLDSALWKGNRTGAIMSWYFSKAGRGNYTNAIEAGSARAARLPGGANAAQWPAEARQYWEAVTAARAQFQRDGKPTGGGRLERIKNALVALQSLNGAEWSAHNFGTPEHPFTLDAWTASAVEMESWEHDQDYGVTSPVTDKNITEVWEGYAAFFEMAPLTNASTPSPKTLEETLSPQAGFLDRWISPLERAMANVRNFVKEGAQRVDKQMGELGESIERATLFVGLGVLGLGVLWVLTRSKA